MKKVVLIAGGTRGIGKYLAKGLREDFLVGVCGRTAKREDSDGFFACKCDLTKRRDIRAFVSTALDKFLRLDTVIYNAGLMLYDDLLCVNESDLDATYKVIVKGYLFLCQEILPVMRKQRAGHIINISSTRGITAAAGKGVYSAMKRAATSLTDSVRLENAIYGIKATSVHFGIVDTESSQEKYGDDLQKMNPISLECVLKTIKFLLSVEGERVTSLIVGGRL